MKKCKILCFVLSAIMLLGTMSTGVFAATALYNLTVKIAGSTGGNVSIVEQGTQGTRAYEADIPLDASRTIKFIPETGYVVESVTVNNTPVMIADNKLTLKMDDNKTVEVTFKEVGSTTFKVLKKDSAGKALGGAEFILMPQNLQSIDEYTARSDENGIATFTNIPYGSYALYERIAPYGYVRSEVEYAVNISGKGGVINIAVNQTGVPAGTAPIDYQNGETVAEFVNTKDQTVAIDVTIKKTVDGKDAPKQAFTFELLRIVDEDDMGVPIFEAAEEIKDVYEGSVTRTLNVPQNELGNLFIREKQGGSAGWTYSNTIYVIEITARQGAPATVRYLDFHKYNDPAKDVAEFKNSYSDPYGRDGIAHWPVNDPTDKEPHKDADGDGKCDKCGGEIKLPENNSTKSPKTADSSLALWIALLLVGIGGVTAAKICKKSKTVK